MTRLPVSPAGPAGSRPIGVFDSGVGGLSILAELRTLLPHEDFVYLADTAHCPYGERPAEDIERLTLGAVRWLEQQGCKLVVIACNTACAFSLRSVRAAVGLPVVGLVPALKPAAEQTLSRVVAVFATPVTLEGSLLREVTEQVATPARVQVLKVWHRDLVPLVESGQADSAPTRRLLGELLTPVLDAGADALVLGCTHYPFLVPALKASFGDAFRLYDSGAGVARQTRALLSQAGQLNPGTDPGATRLYTTGDPAPTRIVARQLYAGPLEVQAVPLPDETEHTDLPTTYQR